MTDASIADNIRSPIFLYSKDNPRLVPVSHILIGLDYCSWCRALRVALHAKDKVGFIDGIVLQPPETYPNFTIWFKVHKMVVS